MKRWRNKVKVHKRRFERKNQVKNHTRTQRFHRLKVSTLVCGDNIKFHGKDRRQNGRECMRQRKSRKKPRIKLQVTTSRSVVTRNRFGWFGAEGPTDRLSLLPIGWAVTVFTRLSLMRFLLLINLHGWSFLAHNSLWDVLHRDLWGWRLFNHNLASKPNVPTITSDILS